MNQHATSPAPSTSPAPISKEESAILIKALWKGLTTPPWTRDDMIEFGKVVFAKISLSSMPAELFKRLLPYLQAIVGVMAAEMSNSPSLHPTPPPPQPSSEKNHE